MTLPRAQENIFLLNLLFLVPQNHRLASKFWLIPYHIVSTRITTPPLWAPSLKKRLCMCLYLLSPDTTKIGLSEIDNESRIERTQGHASTKSLCNSRL